MLEMCYEYDTLGGNVFLEYPFCLVYGVDNFTFVVSTSPGLKRSQFVPACGLLTLRYVRRPLQDLLNSWHPKHHQLYFFTNEKQFHSKKGKKSHPSNPPVISINPSTSQPPVLFDNPNRQPVKLPSTPKPR